MRTKLTPEERRARRDARSKSWREANREHHRALCRAWNKRNKGYKAAYDKVKYAANKSQWMGWLTSRGLTSCSMCGYSQCFDAIDFHHVNPATKEVRPNTLWAKKFNPHNVDRAIQETNKCVSLCKNCHAELHYKLKEEKRNVQTSDSEVPSPGLPVQLRTHHRHEGSE